MSTTGIAGAALIAGCFALALGAALRRTVAGLPVVAGALAVRIDALLPQTQCGRCSYAGCRPYAEAIARGEAGTDQCPPGGDDTARALAVLLGREPRPVDPAYGVIGDPLVAIVDEARCIGCARCLPACPVDAIVGATRRMHTVIADLCTGCELCLPPCPVDCIAMVPAPVVAARRVA